ncbi:MAG: hypothetical protein KQ78_01830 [Candidatus Izimaplasma bacterium HR2]|nr:MAG: hypothetical protein KQ78_01830 [Candidatus Izimaplasma bacterium HR2]
MLTYRFEIPELSKLIDIETREDGTISQGKDSISVLTELSKLVLKKTTVIYCKVAEVLPGIGINDKKIQWRYIPASLGILRIFSYIDKYVEYLEDRD